MLGLYLALVAAWLWGCLVFAPKPGRVAVLLPVVVLWAIFVAFGAWLFDRLIDGSRNFFDQLNSWLDGLGQPTQEGREV